MSVITIARGTLSGTTKLASSLADDLGYRVVMREEVYEAAKVYGIEETGLGTIGIVDQQPPSFWHRFTDLRRQYLVCFKAALLDLALADNLIYVGHLAHLLLSGYPRVLRVRLAATDAYRIARLREERGIDEREAVCVIRDVDDRRLRWSQFLYGVDWRDPVHYDLVINPEKIDVATAAKFIADLARSPVLKTTPEDVALLQSLRLTAKVRLALLKSLRTRGIDLGITADAATGEVKVLGNPPGLGASAWERDLKGVITQVEGVGSVVVVHGPPEFGE
ncbi:MAG: cytidylate kinase-like family protein [Candidatus Riflebacteria bacterium]|nr:cytidylate kinase-like family protein [Candidatus Riflebacteria bacterium]